MGARKNRIFALLVAVVMIFTSAIGVFASEESSVQGSNNAVATEVKTGSGTINVATSGAIKYSVNGGAEQTVASSPITGLKSGALVKISTSAGDSYRWMKKATIKKAKKKKVTWKKVKGASYYLVKVVKDGKTYYKKVKGKSITAKKLGLKSLKGAKVQVRPLKSSGGHVYVGAFSKTKKVKK